VYPLENTVFLSTDQYNDELGSVYIFDIKNNRFTFRDNIPIKKKVKKIYLDNSKNLYILAEGSLIYFPYDFLYAQEGLFSFSILSSTGEHQWHRLSIEGDIPDGSSVKVYLSTNTQKYAVFENSKDIYIPEGLKGKELNIKIVLNSDFSRKKSPVIRYISIFYPRKTYLDYLPQVYKEDAESKDILERYLSILQTVNQSLEKKIKDTPYLLDPLLADAEFLNWLSGWFGLERDGSLEEKKWREFLKEAYNLFKIKGTRKFFERLIEIFCDEKPYIIEPFQVEQCSAREDINLKDEYSFCIFIKENKNIQTVRKLVNRFSPSHTEGKSMVMPEFILLGSFVLLGVNSFIHKPLPVLEKGLINIDSYLEDIYTGSRIEQKSRLSIDTKLDI
jgi:phage tail-like protein